MDVAHGIVASDELLVQSRMFVIDTRVHHGDVDVGTGEAEVPRTHGVETGIAGFDSRRLNVAVEDDVSIALDHDHIIKVSELEGQRGIKLAKQDRIHGFNDINDGQVHAFKDCKMNIADLDTVGQSDTGCALKGLQTVVNIVSVLIKRRAFPPRGVVVQPCCFGLLWHFKTVASGHPLHAFCVHSLPTERFGFDHQGTGDRPHQQRKHQHRKHSTHVLPHTRRTSCLAST